MLIKPKLISHSVIKVVLPHSGRTLCFNYSHTFLFYLMVHVKIFRIDSSLRQRRWLDPPAVLKLPFLCRSFTWQN